MKIKLTENKKVYSQEIAKKHGFERAYYDPHHDVEIWERDGRYISVKPEPEMTTDADYVFDNNGKRTYINPKGKKPVFPSTNKVKLSENELKQIVAESVKKTLNEWEVGPEYTKERQLQYVYQAMRRLNYLLYEEVFLHIGPIIRENETVRKGVQEIGDLIKDINNIMGIRNDNTLYRYERLESPSEFYRETDA
jgi:hypothetical protein